MKHDRQKKCIDDFGVKYFNKEDAEHLISSLQEKYEITID